MENWTEIKITVDAARVDEAGAIASMTVPYGIYIEDYSNLENRYCLERACQMRSTIRKQLALLDIEYAGKTIPKFEVI